MVSKIIIDCDPGHDDAIAILLAAGNPEIDLLAVTTVVGNQTLPKVTRNALAVADIAQLTGVPIAAGCTRPLIRDHDPAAQIHGDSGLGGVTLDQPHHALDPRHAVEVIIDTVMAHEPGTVTLVPMAPLTNIALAVRLEPRLVERVQRVVLMGGGYHRGNVSAVAEFNIAVDPEAAHIVFGAGWPVTMVGLDLTHQALATPEIIERIRALSSAPSRFVGQLLEFYGRAYAEHQGFTAPPVHDPCAVAHVIDASVVTTRRAPLTVELTGTETRGMTVADLRRDAPADCPTSVAVDLDHARFWDLVIDALQRLP